MTATKGAMTSLPTSQTIYLPVEEAENNRINFRDSLKFFQEQLVINGASFPSPSACREGNDTLKKNGPRFCKEQHTDNNVKEFKDGDMFEGEVQSVRSCKIAIPTVDTILKSVRVLRAIQKSQKERGLSWNLDITSKSDIESDFNLKNDWIQVEHINHETYSQKELKTPNGETVDTHTVDTFAPKQVPEFHGNKQEIITDSTDISTFVISNSNTFNGNNSFWPSINFDDENHWDNETSNLAFSVELTDKKAEFHVLSISTENLKCEEITKPITIESTEKKEVKENDINELPLKQINIINNKSKESEPKTCTEIQINEINLVNSDEKSCDTKDSLAECDKLLTSANGNDSNTDNLGEIVGKIPNSGMGILKIETFEHIDTHKDDFLLAESVWKAECSPNSSSSTKLESNDSDSGIGTQRSASSLSPNITNQMQKDSWSDTCSSHYASAECSPYHSLNNIFDSSMGLNQSALPTEDIHVESSTNISNCEWEDAAEKSQENTVQRTEERASLSPGPTEFEVASSVTEEHSSLSPGPAEFEVESSVAEEHSSLSLEPTEFNKESSFAEEHSFLSPAPTEFNKESFAEEHSLLSPEPTEFNKESSFAEEHSSLSPGVTEFGKESEVSIFNESDTDAHIALRTPENGEGIEQDTEGTYCFVSNYTLESPSFHKTDEPSDEVRPVEEICDTLNELPKSVIEFKPGENEKKASDQNETETTQSLNDCPIEENDEVAIRLQKFTAAACDLMSIVESLYSIKESPAFQVLPATDEKFEETLYILSEGAFCDHPEGNYFVTIEDSILHITKDSQVLLSVNMKYGEVSVGTKNILKVDNRMGRWVYIKCDFESLINLKTEIELHCLKHWQTDCLELVHYPLKCHQNVVIVDLGSCSTRAGILMDQPTLPSIFFPTICATDRKSGTSVYGMEALQPEVRQHSNLSFPVRPSIKITKHTIDIELLQGLFKKIFVDLNIDPTEYTVQVCLPRNLSINAQNALVKLLLEDLNVKSVSLANQALLTLYAHDISTAVVVNIGDRTEVLPVVDGFIVENGVTKLPHGGQRLIHHMKHGLAEKRLSLSNDIDSFVVQYIVENLAYVAEDFDREMQIASKYPDLVKKMITLQPVSSESTTCKSITLEEARFKVSEGLFNPELWGLDSPGIHHLVNKAIQATGVDVRKRIAENIYVSGGVTMLPGFIERLSKEVTKLSKAKIVPKVFASNYRYHCTYIGACKFAKMDVFPQVCISLEEYTRNSTSSLKKCALCF